MGTPPKPGTIPLIRLGHPLAFGAFLRKVGSPVDRLFGRVGLPVYCDDPTAFVPLRQAWSLFHEAARLEDPMLGWNMGRFHGDNKLSAGLLRQLETAPTLYRALHRFVRLISTEASHLQLGILERRDEIVFYTGYATIKDWPGYSVSQSYQLEAFLDLIRRYLGPHWVPEEIGIESATAPTVAQEHFPDARIRTKQRLGYITVPRSCLHTAPAAGHSQGPGEGSLVLSRDFDYIDTVKAVIEAYTADGYPSRRKVAALLDTSVRTLLRRLWELGATYQGLVDEVRFKKARELLRSDDLRVLEVARSVGFDDPAHFARMFRRVGGLAPREFRNAARV